MYKRKQVCSFPLRTTYRPQERNGLEGEEAVDGSKRMKSPSTGVFSSVSAVSVVSGDRDAPLNSPSTPSHIIHKEHVDNHAKDACEGCKSVRTGYVSHDDEAELSYFSTQQPHIPQIFMFMRQACIRSLSCEVCPGREGPIFFGDEQNGYVLSYTFYVKDTQARGLQRWYSIIVFMMDRIYLLNSWPFLVPQLRTIIEVLQKKAQKVWKEEVDKNPQGVSSRMAFTLDPGNFLKQRGCNNKPARSLDELTGDKSIFKMLHVAFVWTLKACGSRITETLLEGPPTEDSIIDMEKQEETEEGFIKLYSRKISSEAKPSASDCVSGQSDETCKKEIWTASGVKNWAEGNVKKPVIRNLRHLKKVLGTERFQKLCHHVVIGDQIIVCCSDKAVLCSVFDALEVLLPRGCCRIIYHSNVYEESYRCNFLGQNPGIVLPDHVLAAERFVIVEVLEQEDWTSDPQDSQMSQAEDFVGYKFSLHSYIPLPEKAPTVLSKMLMALRNENLSEEVVSHCFVCLKEEWMNKVKVLFKFTKAGGARSEDETQKLMQVVGAREEDKPLLKFWMTGLSVQYRTHILASSKQR
ncbi:folliculin-like isoform X2 [Pomacea canaliculata]|uniref:folliculin-like isoform X2 n=1 Tax=Pomacea canaliculata TaxID=400727 RepID=UPI000D73CEA7|nr:folliculin-like isoform X2 [Pomacea canaliculata]